MLVIHDCWCGVPNAEWSSRTGGVQSKPSISGLLTVTTTSMSQAKSPLSAQMGRLPILLRMALMAQTWMDKPSSVRIQHRQCKRKIWRITLGSTGLLPLPSPSLDPLNGHYTEGSSSTWQKASCWLHSDILSDLKNKHEGIWPHLSEHRAVLL